MARTKEQLAQAVADAEAWLDELDPSLISAPHADAGDLRAIGTAMHDVAAADLALAERVAEARMRGRTWTQIAMVLGVSKQAARERFGEHSLT